MFRRRFLLLFPAALLAIFGIDKVRLQRETVIANYIKTPEGKRALAESMLQPIRRNLSRQKAARKIVVPSSELTIQDLYDTVKHMEKDG